ncbi:MAG: class I SAM-dependent methyltransferase [Gallionella sp.]|jgi:SAM-dependent methyltransferase
MVVLPPGTLLQLMYLDERLKAIAPGRFIEVGPGSGEITTRLLRAGWSGTVYDLSGETLTRIEQRFAPDIAAGRLTVMFGDYLNYPPSSIEDRVDLIISCMVMEHLDDQSERKFMEFSAKHLKAGGRMIGLVPASPRHWGIEDDIAGHCRRYTKGSLLTLIRTTGWTIGHIVGLTYPVSNLLLPVSNFLVRRHEASKLSLSPVERTKHSGRRKVRFKTHFPAILKLCLNELTMLPLYWTQKLFANSGSALVLYFEATYEAQIPNDENKDAGILTGTWKCV